MSILPQWSWKKRKWLCLVGKKKEGRKEKCEKGQRTSVAKCWLINLSEVHNFLTGLKFFFKVSSETLKIDFSMCL